MIQRGANSGLASLRFGCGGQRRKRVGAGSTSVLGISLPESEFANFGWSARRRYGEAQHIAGRFGNWAIRIQSISTRQVGTLGFRARASGDAIPVCIRQFSRSPTDERCGC